MLSETKIDHILKEEPVFKEGEKDRNDYSLSSLIYKVNVDIQILIILFHLYNIMTIFAKTLMEKIK